MTLRARHLNFHPRHTRQSYRSPGVTDTNN